MTLKQLNEFNYNGFGDDEFEKSHDEHGKKKPLKGSKKNSQKSLFDLDTPSNSKKVELEKELVKKQNELSALRIKVSRSKNDTQKYTLTNDRITPLIARIQNLQQEIKDLK